MVKILVKLALAALLANAAYRLGSAYLQFYKFKDAVTEVAQFGGQLPVPDLQRRVMDLASSYDVPLAPDAVTVQRDERSHTLIDGAYEQPIDLLPGYRRRWPFEMHVDVLTLGSLK